MEKAFNSKRIILWFVVTVLIAAAIFGIAKVASKSSGEKLEPTPANVDQVSPKDNTKGSRSAKIVMVEYSDFQCPACAAYFPLVKKLNEEMGDKILFVYRNFPLSQHKNAKPSAYAAEAAGKQGKFWEMHDLIFTNQSAWEKESNAAEIFAGYAKLLSLNMDQYNKDVDSDEIQQKVADDYESGEKAGVPGTPTFFVNGKKIPSPRSYEEFKQLIEYIGNSA